MSVQYIFLFTFFLSSLSLLAQTNSHSRIASRWAYSDGKVFKLFFFRKDNTFEKRVKTCTGSNTYYGNYIHKADTIVLTYASNDEESIFIRVGDQLVHNSIIDDKNKWFLAYKKTKVRTIKKLAKVYMRGKKKRIRKEDKDMALEK